jgi:hypothetical protein
MFGSCAFILSLVLTVLFGDEAFETVAFCYRFSLQPVAAIRVCTSVGVASRRFGD